MTNTPNSKVAGPSDDPSTVEENLAPEPSEPPDASKISNGSDSPADGRFSWAEPGLRSLVGGLGGLALITLLFAIAIPIEIGLLNILEVAPPTFLMNSLIIQTLLLPALVCYSCATVTSLFWYGSIVLRFALAIIVALPGCIGFLVGATYKDDYDDTMELLHAFSIVMFTCLLAIAVVALTVQMWSRWTLSHNRPYFADLPRTGIQSMVELTLIAAAGFAISFSNDFVDYVEGMILFGGVGFMAAIATISMQIGFLREGPRSRNAMIVGFVFALATAVVMNAVFAVLESGWDIHSSEIGLIGASSVYGALLICAFMWLCLRWLKFCKWRCVDQRTTQID